MTPGAGALDITANRSTLNVDGGTVSGGNLTAVQLFGSQATLNNATLVSTGSTGLSVARLNNLASSATVNGGSITGAGIGVRVTAGSTLSMNGTVVTANHSAGRGLLLSGGSAQVTGGSITGGNLGVELRRESAATPTAPNLTLDGTSVTGQAGSAIQVGNDTVAGIILRNGATLHAGNGTLLDVQDRATTTMSVETSGLAGNLQVGNAAKLDLTLDRATLEGNITAGSGSSTQVALRNGSAMKGAVQASDGATFDMTFDQAALEGSITADASSTVRAALSNGSALKGNVENLQSLSLAGGSSFQGAATQVGRMSISDTSSWTLSGNSTVKDLDVQGGTVVFGDNGSFHELTVANLTGNGNFHMAGDFETGQADQLVVTGSSTGNHGLLVGSSGQEASVESLRLVQTADGGAQFHLLNDRERVDVGAYSYELAQDGNDWVLNRETRTVAPITMAAMALFNTPITVAYGELSSLRSRMGELRYSEGRNAGVWMRAYGNQYNVSGASLGAGYQQNQRGLSLGADMQLADSDWLVGVLAGSSRSDLNLDYGTSGTVDSYYVGGYATWLDRETGFYVDTVVKYNRYQNNAKVGMSDHTRSKGDYDTHGVSASVEAGKHIKLNDGYFIEPFVQVATAAVAGKDYTFDNGLRAEGDMAKSLLGKVGTTVGKTIPLDGGAMVQPYVKGAFAHEFAQRNQVQVNNNVFNNDLSGSRAELGAGVSLALSRQFRVHADVEYSNGKNIEQPYGVNVGVRYDF
ncbi:autotransporter outer membrane beta-barrel domain-containing protein [Pseudomonas entomophila]|uniref:autotransporter outer membrane beta-barrel domain-containing protein n=1 Tax=Pseudomonas entomophila TaxID=312306 RepID=UPI00240676CC|nr:autotransporter outer membrane beta-barrel domain-containing protein [Pseudomonas entomophila]MDF9616018.1 autotransporter outer membrane beta-barrel domain-containing protein [Pseudomonas entomophila]